MFVTLVKNTMSLACYRPRTKWYPDAYSRCATTDVGRKLAGVPLLATSVPSRILIHPAVWRPSTWAKNWGGGCVSFWGELGLHLAQCGMGRGLPSYQVAS